MREICVILLLLLFPSSILAADYFSWSTRIDRDGKPAGIYASTPFPITEDNTVYSITSDEGTKTFTLGTIYFVDNAASGCVNGDIDYSPATRACGGGTYTVYTSPSNAITGVSAGNKTILVRAGTYSYSARIVLRAGDNTTHRYSMIGYNQERPVISGSPTGGLDSLIGMGNYSTLQRLKVTNHHAEGVDAQAVENDIIDVWVTNCPNTDGAGSGDGNIYAAGSTNLWLYHNTSEHTYGHCVKISDGAAGSIQEWSIARECGYWTGIDNAYGSHHASGFDYPDIGADHTLRYSIVYDTLFYAVNIRGNTAYDARGIGTVNIHHMEIYNSTHLDARPNARESSLDAHQVLLDTAYSNTGTPNIVNFYANIVRDGGGNGGDIDTNGFDVGANFTATAVNAYNNLFYGNPGRDLYIRYNNACQSINYWNNTIYHDNNTNLYWRNATTTSVVDMKNNLFFNAGTAATVSGVVNTHTYNLFWYPSGSLGFTKDATDINANPLIVVPSGVYSSGEGSVLLGSPAIDNGTTLSAPYSLDILGVSRPQGAAWDIGAYEYLSGASPDAFYFANISGANVGKEYTSNSQTITGLVDVAVVTISGSECTWNKNAGAFSASSGTVVNNDNVSIKARAPSTYLTPSPGCTLTINGVNNVGAPWIITTRSHRSSSPFARYKFKNKAWLFSLRRSLTIKET
jgi:hypothetical protein